MIMSNLKKLAALVLALMMILSLTSSMASETELGSITINNVSEETTYSIYKLLDLESYDPDSGAYSYKVNSQWTAFFASADVQPYFTVDEAGYVTWVGGENNASATAAFAKLALAYAKANGIDPVQSSANEGEFVITGVSGKFSNLELGYYLIDSTMGALCGLTTTNPDAYLNAKNGTPTVSKQVKEDSTSQWDATNTADIGQIVEFRTTIGVHPGAENYVLHDKMSAGLTFLPTKTVTGEDGVETEVSLITVERIDTSVSNDPIVVDPSMYTVIEDPQCEDAACTFEISFVKELTDLLDTNDKLIIHYSAMVNRNAVIGDTGNPNETWLEFGEEHFTTHSQTTTRTYSFDLIKTDSQNELIDGAEFRIYDAPTGGNEVKVVLMDDGVTYRRAREDEEGVAIVVKNGQVTLVGFDNGTYYLEEIKTPEGYNQLTSRKDFTIADENLEATFNDGICSVNSGVQIINKSGTMLPETGGIGTTLFYIVGGCLVIAAVVLLITKKRMSNAE